MNSELMQTREGFMMLHGYNLEARARRERENKRQMARHECQKASEAPNAQGTPQ